MGRRAIRAMSIGAVVLAWVATGAMQDRFPDGEGKAEMLKVCGECHEPDNVFAFPKMAPEWTLTLADMKQRGTEATPQEWQAIELYLDKYFALIPINTSPADELVRTMDVTPAVADAIVTYRKESGPFKSVDDLKKVSGLDAAKVDARKDRLLF
jgi:competence protein ComEA